MPKKLKMKEEKIEILNEKMVNKTVVEKIEYSNTIFHEKFTFACVDEFKEDVAFSKCIFNKDMIIHSCDFKASLYFHECVFYSNVKLSVLDIKDNLEIVDCKFSSNFDIIDSSIHEKTSISKCKFFKGINLFSNDDGSFGNVAFEGGLNIFG